MGEAQALSLGYGSAACCYDAPGAWQAQDGVGGTASLTTNADGLGNAGVAVVNGTASTVVTAGGVKTTNGFGNFATTTTDVGTSYAGFVAGVGYTNQSIAMSGVGITGTNAAGNQTFSVDSATGDITTAGAMRSAGLITGNNGLTITSGGANITGGTTTDNLKVTSLSQGVVVSDPSGNVSSTTSLTGANSLSSLNVTGNTSTGSFNAGAAGNTSIDTGGNLTVGTPSQNANLTVNGLTTTNGIINTGNVTTDSLMVNQGASFAGGNTQINGATGAVTVTSSQGIGVLSSTVIGVGSANGTVAGIGIGGSGNAGFATFAGPGLTNQTFSVDSATGNIKTAGTITSAGLIKANGGLTVNGTTTLNGATNVNGVATFTNTAIAGQGATSVSGGLVTLTNGTNPAQQIVLNANADPVLTVTDGTTAGTTTINNGVVTAGTSVNAPTVNATTVNATTVNATTGNIATLNSHNVNISNNLAVAPGANVDMGGNVMHDVGTPIVGTDAANKAYVDKGVHKAYEGTALALAISQPMFMPGQSFAIRAGWGEYEGENAAGVSAAGVIARNVFGYGSTIVVDAGVGVGANYNGVAGKAGVTLGFGGAAPLK